MTYNHKHINWIQRTFLLVMSLSCKQFMVFLGCKSLGSRRAFILRSTLFLFIPTSIDLPHTCKALSLSNNTHILLFLKFLFSLFFYYCFLIFLCGCYLSYHNYCHPTSSPKFGTNLLWTMMLRIYLFIWDCDVFHFFFFS